MQAHSRDGQVPDETPGGIIVIGLQNGQGIGKKSSLLGELCLESWPLALPTFWCIPAEPPVTRKGRRPPSREIFSLDLRGFDGESGVTW